VTRTRLILAFAALSGVLIIGVPLFLRTPVWVDVTYHDISAWNILHGGVHYRDVFETNLPGMVWLHCLVRPVIGWSHEAIRVVDLLVIGTVVILLARMMRNRFPSPPASGAAGGRGGLGVRQVKVGPANATSLAQPGSPPSPLTPLPPKRGESGTSFTAAIWFAVAVALFYLFETEFIHCQRDGWMLLPAVAATSLRVRRIVKAHSVGWSVLEGILWGCAVWIKPHVLLPALLVWLVSLRFQARRAALRDTLALIAGGVIAGAAGTIWLVRTGTWPHMWDVLLNWNQEYYRWSWSDLWFKIRLVSGYFAPFSLLHFVAVPVAVVAMVRRDPPRAVVAALYVGWLVQATVIQKVFDYAHAPPTILGLAVLASFRVPVGPIFLTWCLAAGLANEFAAKTEWMTWLKKSHPITARVAVPHHPIAQRDRLALWGRCWHDNSWEFKDQLSFYPYTHSIPQWAELQQVADFLRTKNLKDRELICWHDSTHPLYIWLEIRPGLRFPHVITAMKFRSKLDVIRREAFESPARYVVSDLVPVTYLNPLGPFAPAGPMDHLPPEFPPWGKDVYPWNQPVVFQAGRYIVHEVKDPRGEIDFPLPEAMKEQ
jgi:hypothetical protein